MRIRFLIHTLGIAALACALGAQGQMVYRIVGADGRITYSDKPPAGGSAAKVEPVTAGSSGGAATSAGLPYELREAVSRFPVTLYTGNDCGPCTAGRSFLSGRGVPFSERTVQTQEDATALKNLSGEASLPFLTIGGQRIKGFSEADWSQYLDAAGYPKSSQLPNGYRNPAPSPLVAVQRAPAPAQEAQPKPAATPVPAPVAPAPSNPAGIQF